MYIRAGANGTLHCREEKIPEGAEFPKVWEWLSDPKTTKEEKTVNGTEYIFYTGHVSYSSSAYTQQLVVQKVYSIAQSAIASKMLPFNRLHLNRTWCILFFRSVMRPLYWEWQLPILPGQCLRSVMAVRGKRRPATSHLNQRHHHLLYLRYLPLAAHLHQERIKHLRKVCTNTLV